MTGPEFAANHGNDSSTWSSADFETEMNLAEADALPEPVKAWMAMANSLDAAAGRIRAAHSTHPAA
ncbi:hypothetical protein ACIQVL_48905 [Streptomyces sp. NPDC090499]|uniref:hypothetical protein n=1 Tax=Streptomyces sp. NPDC090499 TaxID=3365965 RepID=UPI003825EE2F